MTITLLSTAMSEINSVIHVSEDIPFFKALCWQTNDIAQFSLDEMLSRYERGWIYLDIVATLGEQERVFLRQLAKRRGSWIGNEI